MNEPKPVGPGSATRRRNKSVQAPDESPEASFAAAPAPRHSRLLTTLAKGLLFTGLVGVLIFGIATGARRFFVSTSRFAIDKVEAVGSRRFGDEQLLRLAGLARGDNLFAVDLAAAEQALLQDPWIASARISRRIPDTLVLSITEHVAAALAAIDGALYLVTEQGEPIKEVGEGDAMDYPVVTGVSAEALTVDRARAQERIESAIAILRRYERLPLGKVQPAQELHMAEDGTVRLVVGHEGITFHLGRGPFRQKLLMAARALGKVQARSETPHIIFLDNEAHPERVVVRMR